MGLTPKKAAPRPTARKRMVGQATTNHSNVAHGWTPERGLIGRQGMAVAATTTTGEER